MIVFDEDQPKAEPAPSFRRRAVEVPAPPQEDMAAVLRKAMETIAGSQASGLNKVVESIGAMKAPVVNITHTLPDKPKAVWKFSVTKRDEFGYVKDFTATEQ